MKVIRASVRYGSELTPIERAILATVPLLIAGLLLSLPLLAVPTGSDPFMPFMVQLTFLVIFGAVLAHMVVAFGTLKWFDGAGWSAMIEKSASGVALVVLVTGTVGLVALASSAALRFDPSTQFLQLISALDIAWVVAAITIGTYRAWGRAWAVAGGVVVGAVCVWSIGMYLSRVGFGPNGEWIVSAPDLMELVLPYDMVAAIVAVSLFAVGVRASISTGTQETEQPNPQS